MHGTTGATVHIPNVQFGEGGGVPLFLDILRPDPLPAAPMPAVVYIHGGAWFEGHRWPTWNDALNGCGFFTVSIDYRLSHQATFPAQIEDCKAAVRWLRAHAAEYHVDPARIGVWGHSAGAHLAALLGTSGDVPELEGSSGNARQSSRVQAVVTLAPPVDLARMGGWHDAPDSPESRLVGGPILERPAIARMANPITYLQPSAPPFLLIHGGRDQIVPVGQSHLLHDALRAAGVDVSFDPLPGADHWFSVTPGDERFMPMVGGQARAFFIEHLKP
jgi:acetyl esterase/lipase